MRHLVALVLLCTPLAVWSQVETGHLTGYVSDAETGEGLPGANVVLNGTGLGAATDIHGRYTIFDVPPGTYTALARFVGYEPLETKVKVQKGRTTRGMFALHQSDIVPFTVCGDCGGALWIQRDPFVSRVLLGADIALLPVER